jgi:hypothetical protein
VKKVAFGIIWFVVLWIGASAICGGIVGGLASQSPPAVQGAKTFSEGAAQGYQAGHAAGEEFGRRYGSLILIGALVVAVVGSATGILPGTKNKPADDTRKQG